MTQYDAGPGDWSDREWEAPDKKQRPHATKPRLVLPPWALLASLIGIVILVVLAWLITIPASAAVGVPHPGARRTKGKGPLRVGIVRLLCRLLGYGLGMKIAVSDESRIDEDVPPPQ